MGIVNCEICRKNIDLDTDDCYAYTCIVNGLSNIVYLCLNECTQANEEWFEIMDDMQSAFERLEKKYYEAISRQASEINALRAEIAELKEGEK